MTTETADDLATCWRCGGPCLTYKGSVHGWTCSACIAQYLELGAAKADARDRRDRERLQRTLVRNDHQTLLAANGRRRDGGGPDVFRTPAPASTTSR